MSTLKWSPMFLFMIASIADSDAQDTSASGVLIKPTTIWGEPSCGLGQEHSLLPTIRYAFGGILWSFTYDPWLCTRPKAERFLSINPDRHFALNFARSYH